MDDAGMRKETAPRPDPLVLLARANAQKQSRRFALRLVLAAVILIALLGLVFWLVRPDQEPPALTVIAFDQVGRAGEALPLRAVLGPRGEAPEGFEPEGYEIRFVDPRLATQVGGGGNKLLLASASTGAGGEAEITWQFPLSPRPILCEVRYLGSKKGTSALDRAKVYPWPADARVVLVDVRGLLKTPGTNVDKANVYKLPPAAGAPEALKQVRGRKYRIVYLATAERRPEGYHKLRGWVQRPAGQEGTLFPEGPVLGRPSYAGGDEAGARRSVVQALKRSFPGKIMAVAGTIEEARGFQEEGLTTILVGGAGDVPVKVQRVKSWKELAQRLP
jgi:hypothetical protein